MSFFRRLALEFAIDRIGDVYGCPHIPMLPYLWQVVKDFPDGTGKEKPERAAPVLTYQYLFYCPALATTGGVIISGRFSSRVSSVPARNAAE